jgi:hypothetical protein
MSTISRSKFVVFAVVTVSLVFVTACGSLLAVDLHLHGKFEKAAGLNIWGYRGPTAGRKRPGEIRVAVIGGSTALGYGLAWTDAFLINSRWR